MFFLRRNFFKKKAKLAVLLFGLASTAPLPASVGNVGSEFWLTFPQADHYGTRVDSLLVTSETNTNGQVQIPGIGYSASFTVSAGSTTVLSVPLTAEADISDSVTQLGIHLTAVSPVAVYGISYEQYSDDGYLALPVNALGDHYIAMAYTNSQTITGAMTEFTVVGTQNATSVTITPSTATGTRSAGVAFTVGLNQGDVYQLQDGTQGADLTGTLIDASLPVGVWGANTCADIPATVFTCNFIVEQLWPIQWWGTRFATWPLPGRTGDTFRFLASQNGTMVSVNGTATGPLNQGQFSEQVLTLPSYITATQPIYVMQYSNGHVFDGASQGDPSMTTVPPLTEFATDYLTSMPVTGFNNNYENIVAPTTAVGAITLDGAPIPASIFSAVGASGYSGAAVSVLEGTHHLSGPVPFGVVEYGSFTRDAYSYPGGAVFITDTPTFSPTPTFTKTATLSPTITDTPTFTNTYTPTPTSTPPLVLWPNPFNPRTAVGGVVKFSYLPAGSKVGIYTITGELVKTLPEVNGLAMWDGRNQTGYMVSAGIYFYVAESGSQVLQTGKILVLNSG
jgi:hypothetical protein